VFSSIAAHTLSRYSSVILIFALPYVRAESATSKPFAESKSRTGLMVSSLISVGIAVALLGWISTFALGLVYLSIYFSAQYFLKNVGGITGDLLGAANQLCEVLFYIGVLLFLQLQPALVLLWRFS
jgi:adenosylcobinamide-GDP ribazoletransferase